MLTRPLTDPSIAELDDAELPSVSQPTTVSLPDAQPDQSIGTQSSSAEPPATNPSVAELDDADPSSVPLSTSVVETPVLFQSTAQPDQSFKTQSPSADHSPDGILDSQGIIKPSDHSQATSSADS